MHRLQELVRLHRMGTGPREVARLLAMSPNIERGEKKRKVESGVKYVPEFGVEALR